MDSEEASATLQHANSSRLRFQVEAFVLTDMQEVGVSCLGWSLLSWLLCKDSGNKE